MNEMLQKSVGFIIVAMVGVWVATCAMLYTQCNHESRISKLEHSQHNQTNTVRFVTSFDDK